MLVQAYTEAFLPSDKVALIVHSSYGDQFWKQELQDAMGNTSQPVVLFFQVRLLLLLYTPQCEIEPAACTLLRCNSCKDRSYAALPILPDRHYS